MSFSKYFGSGATGKSIDKYLNKNSSPTKPVQGTTSNKEKQLGNYSTTTPKPTTTSNNKNLGNYSKPSTSSSSKSSSGGSGRSKSYVNPSPAVNKPASNQYQYANYDSNNKFLLYDRTCSGLTADMAYSGDMFTFWETTDEYINNLFKEIPNTKNQLFIYRDFITSTKTCTLSTGIAL